MLARGRLVILIVLALGLAVGGAQASSGASVTTVATGLNNPRGLEVGPGGVVYVAEAGSGGETCFGSGQNEVCIGLTGSVTRIAGGEQRRIATGLFSAAGADGSFAVGPDDVALSGGAVYAIMASAPPEDAQGLPLAARRQIGRLFRVHGPSRTAIANVGRFEVRLNPDGRDINPNPYGVVAGPRGVFYVVDAGGNTLLRVERSGSVSLAALFPPETVGQRQVQSVPTAVTWGPDGALYVGELGGDHMPPGKSRIFRIDPFADEDEDEDEDVVQVFATGFTAISGIDFAPDGTLYVTEQFGGWARLFRGDFTGALIRVAPNGRRTELARGKLVAPGGVAVGPGKRVYVSVNSFFPGGGSVVRLQG